MTSHAGLIMTWTRTCMPLSRAVGGMRQTFTITFHNALLELPLPFFVNRHEATTFPFYTTHTYVCGRTHCESALSGDAGKYR